MLKCALAVENCRLSVTWEVNGFVCLVCYWEYTGQSVEGLLKGEAFLIHKGMQLSSINLTPKPGSQLCIFTHKQQQQRGKPRRAHLEPQNSPTK